MKASAGRPWVITQYGPNTITSEATVLEGTETNVLDSVEFAQVSRFGEMGQWRYLEQTDSSGLRGQNLLNTERTGLQLVRVGRFLYAIGGRNAAGTVAFVGGRIITAAVSEVIRS